LHIELKLELGAVTPYRP